MTDLDLKQRLAVRCASYLVICFLLTWACLKAASWLVSVPLAFVNSLACLAIAAHWQWEHAQLDALPYESDPATHKHVFGGLRGEALAQQLREQQRHTQQQQQQQQQQRRKQAASEGLKEGGWRAKCGSRVIEFAWDRLCNSILQQWVYEAWWQGISPDREFPALVRRYLNEAFGEFCRRLRCVDLCTQLSRDVCETVVDAIEAHRDVSANVGPLALAAMPVAERERTLRSELMTSQMLHPALALQEGHYRVLRAYAECILTRLLSSDPALKLDIARCLVRELLMICVLRPIIMLFWPGSIYKLALPPLEALAQKQQQQQQEQEQQQLSAQVGYAASAIASNFAPASSSHGSGGASAKQSAQAQASSASTAAKEAAEKQAATAAAAASAFDFEARASNSAVIERELLRAATAAKPPKSPRSPRQQHPPPYRTSSALNGPPKRRQARTPSPLSGFFGEGLDFWGQQQEPHPQAAHHHHYQQEVGLHQNEWGGSGSGLHAQSGASAWQGPHSQDREQNGGSHHHQHQQQQYQQQQQQRLNQYQQQSGRVTELRTSASGTALHEQGHHSYSHTHQPSQQQCSTHQQHSQGTGTQHQPHDQHRQTGFPLHSSAPHSPNKPSLATTVSSPHARHAPPVNISRVSSGQLSLDSGTRSPHPSCVDLTALDKQIASAQPSVAAALVAAAAATEGWSQGTPQEHSTGTNTLEHHLRSTAQHSTHSVHGTHSTQSVHSVGGPGSSGLSRIRPGAHDGVAAACSASTHTGTQPSSSAGVHTASSPVSSPSGASSGFCGGGSGGHGVGHVGGHGWLNVKEEEVAVLPWGWLRASVVAPEICGGGEGFKARAEVVVYKIRVDLQEVAEEQEGAPSPRSWTVAHRFREFEALHSSLQHHPGPAGVQYRALGVSPPPKQIRVMLTHDTQLIAQRVIRLHQYLVALLNCPEVVASQEVLQFLGCPRHLSASAAELQHLLSTSDPAASRQWFSRFRSMRNASAGQRTSMHKKAQASTPAQPASVHASDQAPLLPGSNATNSLQRHAGQASMDGASGENSSWLGGSLQAALPQLPDWGGGSFITEPAGASPPRRSHTFGHAAEAHTTSTSAAQHAQHGTALQPLQPSPHITMTPLGPHHASGATDAAKDSEQHTGLSALSPYPPSGTPPQQRPQSVSQSGATFGALHSTGLSGSSASHTTQLGPHSSSGTHAPSPPLTHAGAAPAPDPSSAADPSNLTNAGASQGRSTRPPQHTRTQSAHSTVAAPLLLPQQQHHHQQQHPHQQPEQTSHQNQVLQQQPHHHHQQQQQPQHTGAQASSSGSGSNSISSSSGNTVPPLTPSVASTVPLPCATSKSRASADAHTASIPSVNSSGPANPVGASSGWWLESALLEGTGSQAASASLSSCLYMLLDSLFQLQSRGFIGRQVVAITRAMLSVVAGDAVDDALLVKLRAVTSEHSIARAILALQRMLWPGGVWFATVRLQQQVLQQMQQQIQRQQQQQQQAHSASAAAAAAAHGGVYSSGSTHAANGNAQSSGVDKGASTSNAPNQNAPVPHLQSPQKSLNAPSPIPPNPAVAAAAAAATAAGASPSAIAAATKSAAIAAAREEANRAPHHGQPLHTTQGSATFDAQATNTGNTSSTPGFISGSGNTPQGSGTPQPLGFVGGILVGPGILKPPPAPCLLADDYLRVIPPPDKKLEAAQDARLRTLLLGPLRPTGPLLRLLGPRSHTAGMTRLCDMLASPTFTFQIGYGWLDCLMLALFPEDAAAVMQQLRSEAYPHAQL